MGFAVNSFAQVEQPNVVLIFMDDMGFGDFESYGGTGYQTPHTNKMAAEGMRFTQFYVSQPVCSASRAALMTGSYSNRVGISGALMPWSTRAMNPTEETIAEVLKKKGYRTGMVGKWHLGDQKAYLPLQQGFDEYYGLPYSNDMWPMGYDGKPAGMEYEQINPNKLKHPLLPLMEGNERIGYIETMQDQATLTTNYTKRAVKFIEENRNSPFFLYVAHSMPHVPLAVSEKFKGKSETGLYGDVMMELDWSVGEILNTLERLKMDDNTLVILTSDNGPWLSFGNHGGNAGGLREGKGSAWEGGMRVPCIMQWKNVIPAGTICNKLASTIDLLPTIAKFAKAQLPSKKIDGVDISSLLKNEAGANPREHFVYYQGNKLEAIRKGEWKLVFTHSYRSYKMNPPGYDGWPGKQVALTADYALYNLRSDPGETVDVQERFPIVVGELNALADQYRNTLGDDLRNMKGTERRAHAQVKR